MLPLVLIRCKESLVFVKIPINLLNLRHLPTVVFLSLGEAVVLLASKDFSFAADSELVTGVVELLPQLLFDLIVVVSWLIAIVLFPSFSLSRSHCRLLCYLENALTSISSHEIIKENATLVA